MSKGQSSFGLGQQIETINIEQLVEEILAQNSVKRAVKEKMLSVLFTSAAHIHSEKILMTHLEDVINSSFL